ncbi:MAG: OmpH family outer membrane protein [Deltaproteobacteria bacterium]|nr:OmpH family outer membrane protein [Deltaproteobacteria bacterium]
MKRFFLFLGVLVFFSSQGAAAQKIGFIDLDRILSESSQGKNAKAQFDKLAKPKQEEIQKRQESVKKKIEEFQKKKFALTEEGQKQEEQKLQMEVMEVQQVSQAWFQEMQKKEQELLQPLVEKVRSLIQEIAKAEKYKLVVDKKAPFLLYSDDSDQLTEKVLKRLNKK